MTASAPDRLRYLTGYPPHVLDHARTLLASGGLREWVLARHPRVNTLRTDRALHDHVQALKAEALRSAPRLDKVVWDPRLERVRQALGTHTAVSRVQGAQLKAKREIRIATVFRDGPADFLDMIVAHELAHLREPDHDKRFYALCEHLAPGYHRLELEARFWLTALELELPASPPSPAPPANDPPAA
jgi:predicted metal-dependent hydrolase